MITGSLPVSSAQNEAQIFNRGKRLRFPIGVQTTTQLTPDERQRLKNKEVIDNHGKRPGFPIGTDAIKNLTPEQLKRALQTEMRLVADLNTVLPGNTETFRHIRREDFTRMANMDPRNNIFMNTANHGGGVAMEQQPTEMGANSSVLVGDDRDPNMDRPRTPTVEVRRVEPRSTTEMGDNNRINRHDDELLTSDLHDARRQGRRTIDINPNRSPEVNMEEIYNPGSNEFHSTNDLQHQANSNFTGRTGLVNPLFSPRTPDEDTVATATTEETMEGGPWTEVGRRGNRQRRSGQTRSGLTYRV